MNCELCKAKSNTLFFIKFCPNHKHEFIVISSEHKTEFTREEIGVLNTMFPHLNKRWNNHENLSHAHVHIQYGKKEVNLVTIDKNRNLPNNMFESKKIEKLGTYAKGFIEHLKNGKMLEIGSGFITDYKNHEKFWEMEYRCLDIIPNSFERAITGDITNCPQVPNNSFDFIYSMDLFEHLKEPWKATSEIGRITKPQGIIFISTVFAWRYHESPIDYWRYTPQCLKFLFEKDFDCIEANWDITPRRGLDNIGIQGDGRANDKVPEDNFGAWRENWRCYLVGKKRT